MRSKFLLVVLLCTFICAITSCQDDALTDEKQITERQEILSINTLLVLKKLLQI